MNDDQSAKLLGLMCATWPGVTFTPEQAEQWLETFGPLAPPIAREAIRRLKQTSDFMPSHAKFTEAYNLALRDHNAQTVDEGRALPGGSRFCGDCDHGWVEVVQPGSIFAVAPCERCNRQPRSQQEHPAKCTCSTCHYGPQAAYMLRNGGIVHGGDARVPEQQDFDSEKNRRRLRELSTMLAKGTLSRPPAYDDGEF